MRCVWVALALVAAGCAPARYEFAGLGPVTSEAEARARYANFEVVGVRTEELHIGRLATSELTRLDSNVKAIKLANGVEVEDPRDLIPIVGANTTTAQTANAWGTAREAWVVPSTIASVSSGFGFVGLMTSLMTLGATNSVVPLIISAAVLVVGPLVSLGLGKALLPNLNELMLKSFRAYVDDLNVMRTAYVPRAP